MLETTGHGEAHPEAMAPAQRGERCLWFPRTLASAGGAMVERVLSARGLRPGPGRDAFLNPLLVALHDPSLIPDLDRAAERLLRAAREGERIVIYGDYDVDGISSIAILFHTLRALAPGCGPGWYVPHRLEEGYGLNSEAIAQLCREGARVIVSVDCGVTAREPALVARRAGVDLIITDHHNPPASVEDLPQAFAVVHPRRPDSAYPFGELCGAGVAYKLAWRMCTLASGGRKVSETTRALLIDLLGPAAMGVIADVVPLLGENRVIARHGLGRIRGSSIEGLRALVRACGLDSEKVRADHVGFSLAPRLNACGRLGHAADAVELLTTATGERAVHIATGLSRLNDERRREEQRIAEQALTLATREGMSGPDRRAVVLCDPAWHAGIVGIVCTRLVERLHRPAILMSVTAGVCHGSGRSVPGFNLHDALVSCADLLESFGGHDMAAGLRVRQDRLGAFVERFTGIANERLSEGDLVGRLTYDCDAELRELSRPAVEQFEALGPFGRANEPVRVRLRGLTLARGGETFGDLNRHLRLRVTGPGAAREVTLVAWRWGEHAAKFPRGGTLDAVVAPKVSSWSGAVEAEVLDVAPGAGSGLA